MDSSVKRREPVADSDCISEGHSATKPDASVCSVNPRLVRRPRRRPRDREDPRGRSESRFMQCGLEMRDIPVKDAWAFFRDRRAVASLIPGILVGLNYLEGDGGAGSVSLSTYTPKCTKPGEDSYTMHQVELRDDISHLHVVSCVGGKYTQRYKLFLSFLKVLPDVAFGDSSCTVVWRGEYQFQHSDAAVPKDSMAAQKSTMEMFRDVYNTSRIVGRPISNCSEPGASLKPWRLRGKQSPSDNTSAVLKKELSAQPRRKSRVQCRVKNDEATDEEDEKQKRRGPSGNKCRSGIVSQQSVARTPITYDLQLAGRTSSSNGQYKSTQ